MTLSTTPPKGAHPAPDRQGLALLTLGALGVVYGDIGTSPLYTMQEIFSAANGVPITGSNLIGAVSCVLWALMTVVTLKYVILILRADNRGEGGILALTALATNAVKSRPTLSIVLPLLGVFGATLFYGDSVITPAISVLGALEGLEVVAPSLKPWVVPITVVVLIALFMVQRLGTAAVGQMFGPVLILWFLTLGVTGAQHVLQQPTILHALNPMEALHFLQGRGWHVFTAIGAIVLALTGAEALYADMGHFGRRPIQLAWTLLVLPSLALNYMGQGALLMGDAKAIENPFYLMFPPDWVLPMLVLAALATVIASQAVITGAYSMTRQAIQLGFLPRMTIRQTSAREQGQIYLPAVNWVLLVGVLAAVIGFGSSAALGAAYGIAVTLTMLITTVLTWFVVREGWHLPTSVAAVATAVFLTLDIALVAGCAVKFLDGGWFPLALGVLLFAVMSTWARGRQLVLQTIRSEGLDLKPFIDSLDAGSIPRSSRVAIYPVADPSTVPQALLHNLKHNQVLHQRNVILTVRFQDVPWVPEAERVSTEPLGHEFWRVSLNYGFMEEPNVPEGLKLCAAKGLTVPIFEASFFLSRETVVPTPGNGMIHWREYLFAAMSRNSGNVAAFFRLPDNSVVELGTRVQI